MPARARLDAPLRTAASYASIHDELSECVLRGGEQMKNHFPNLIVRAGDTEAWRHFHSPATGEPFSDMRSWLMAAPPEGVGVGVGKHALSWEDALTLCKGHPGALRILGGVVPRQKAGGDRQSQEVKNHYVLIHNGSKVMPSRKASYLAVRLAQDFPKHFGQYQVGKYKSITAAARAAGILPSKIEQAFAAAKSAYRQLDAEHRKAFHAWQAQQIYVTPARRRAQ